MRFLVSKALFPVKLVVYPVMAVVAALHGVFAVAFAIIVGVVKNFGTIAMAPFASWSVARIENDKITPGTNDIGFPYAMASSGHILVLMLTGLIGALASDHVISANTANMVYKGVAVLLTTNALSGLYEGGRAYANWWTGAKPSQPEAAEQKSMSPQSFLTMLDKIQDEDKVSEEKAWTLLDEAVQVGKNGRMKLGDMAHFVKMVSDRAPTPAVVH